MESKWKVDIPHLSPERVFHATRTVGSPGTVPVRAGVIHVQEKKVSPDAPMTSTAGTDPLHSKRARVDKEQSSDDSDGSDDVIGKTALLVDARNNLPTPSATFFKITEAMPERMRQSLKKNLLGEHKQHSYQIITCRHVDWDDNNRSVLFDDGANTSDELVEEGEMEYEDCDKACEFFSKLLESPPGEFCVVEAGDASLTFVFGLY